MQNFKKKGTNELTYKTERLTDIENKHSPKGKRAGDKLGIWKEHRHTTIHKIHKQQIPTL